MTTGVWCFNTFGSVNDCCESFCFGYMKIIDPEFFSDVQSETTIPSGKYAKIVGGNKDILTALERIKLLHDGGDAKTNCFCAYWKLVVAACCSWGAFVNGCNTCKDNMICRGLWESCVSCPRILCYVFSGPDGKVRCDKSE